MNRDTLKNTTNSRYYKFKRLAKVLNCNKCPPNQCENRKHKAKHGPKSPKYKNKY